MVKRLPHLPSAGCVGQLHDCFSRYSSRISSSRLRSAFIRCAIKVELLMLSFLASSLELILFGRSK